MPAQGKHYNVRLFRLRWWHLIGPPTLVIGIGVLMLLSEFPLGPMTYRGLAVHAVWVTFDDGVATAHEPGYSANSPLRAHPDVHGVFFTSRREGFGWPVAFSETFWFDLRMEPLFESHHRTLSGEVRALVVDFRSSDLGRAGRESLLTGEPNAKQWSVFRFGLNTLLWVCFIVGPIGTLVSLPVAVLDVQRARLNKRYRKHVCPSCKYSLQGLGSLPSLCPECGCTWEPLSPEA